MKLQFANGTCVSLSISAKRPLNRTFSYVYGRRSPIDDGVDNSLDDGVVDGVDADDGAGGDGGDGGDGGEGEGVFGNEW